MKKLKIKQLKAFTLVELIIVITILAILATIAFISFQGFIKDSRDSNRLTTIKNIQNGLEISVMNVGKYPMPEGDSVLEGSINGQIYSYKGEIRDNISRLIRISKTPTDPLTKNNYIYAVSSNLKNYQIATIQENQGLVYDNIIINKVYADEGYVAKVEGNYPGYIKFNSGSELRIANIPSLVYSNTGSISLLSTGTYYVVNNGLNLPYRPKEDINIQNKDADEVIKEITKIQSSTLTGVNITGITTKEQILQVFTGATFDSFNIPGFFSLSDVGNVDKLTIYLEEIVLGKSSVTNGITYSCSTQPTYTNATFTVGSPTSVNQIWQSSDVNLPCYWTCGVGKVLVENNCVSESCSGTTPDGTIAVSNATSIIGGTWNYNITPGLCTFICNTGYIWNSGTTQCEINVCKFDGTTKFDGTCNFGA